MILRISEAQVCGPHSLRLTFSDGTTKQVNVHPLLDGAIFEPLQDPAYFASGTLDSICGTVVWPNGADFAPEALYELGTETMSGSADGSGATPPDMIKKEFGSRIDPGGILNRR